MIAAIGIYVLGLAYGEAAVLDVTVVVFARGLKHPAFRNAV